MVAGLRELAVRWLLCGALFAGVAVAVTYALKALLPSFAESLVPLRRMLRRNAPVPQEVLRLLAIREGGVEEMSRYLRDAGIRIDALRYCCVKRLILLGAGILGASALLPLINSAAAWSEAGIRLLAGCLLAFTVGADKTVLTELKRRRKNAIIRDIYAVSRHLLYHAESGINLHSQLMRCLPYANRMREEMIQLINDWYQDPREALNEFKSALGTEEGRDFAETLDAIRQHQHRDYYQLLQERIQDYKEKLNMAKDSRKELNSYVLFILAGAPILYTFRIFLFPWVQEGERLFRSLS